MSKCLIIGDCGINHNGDLSNALKLIDIMEQSGVDLVKFQKRNVDKLYTTDELNKFKQSPWGTTYGEYKHKLEFGKYEYDEITQHCKINNIQWFASPWDVDSVKFLTKYNMPYFKIASATMTDFDILEEVKNTNVPVIISTGMCTKEEVDKVVNYLGKQIEYILACTSTYPTPPEEMNLNFIYTLKREYPNYKIGFSNHSPGIIFMASAVALGAEMIEFHITLDRSMFGTDQSASIEPEGTRKLVKHVRNLENAMGDGNWTIFPGEIPIKEKLRKK